jgi:hypothetical protein
LRITFLRCSILVTAAGQGVWARVKTAGLENGTSE